VFPEAQHSPPAGCQLGIRSTIPSNVGVELLRPPLAVGPRPCRVIGAAVPKAPIDENNQTQCPPHYVGLAPVVGLRPDVDAIPDAARMKELPDKELGLCVTATLLTHA
jgi:hypothetical protein